MYQKNGDFRSSIRQGSSSRNSSYRPARAGGHRPAPKLAFGGFNKPNRPFNPTGVGEGNNFKPRSTGADFRNSSRPSYGAPINRPFIGSGNRPFNGSQGRPFNRNSGGRPNFARPSSGRSFNRSPRGGQSMKGKIKDFSIFVKQSSEVSFNDTYETKNTFESLNVATPLLANIQKRGYTKLTPVQDQSILPIMEGRDLIGLANTGTGKTAAFLIPIIHIIFTDRTKQAIILTPTRELAMQIKDELESLSAGMHIYASLIIGGANMFRQIHELQRNPHVVIGTPGRIKDLVGRGNLKLGSFSTIVLDEVDLMVDIGFINDVKYFISLLPDVRQSLFFSATISPAIKAVLDNFVKNPVTVTIKQQSTSENVDQDIVKVVDKEKKVEMLHDLLIQDNFEKVLVFGRTKHGIEKLNKQLEARGFKVGAIHGNKKQGHRKRTLESFKRNEIKILLATDVASRGLDIDNVTHVINYDLPESYEDYVHRIGRTGRANKKGSALTFVEA